MALEAEEVQEAHAMEVKALVQPEIMEQNVDEKEMAKDIIKEQNVQEARAESTGDGEDNEVDELLVENKMDDEAEHEQELEERTEDEASNAEDLPGTSEQTAGQIMQDVLPSEEQLCVCCNEQQCTQQHLE